MTDYATFEDVQEVIPDIPVGGVFGAGTTPTDTTVDKWVDQAEGQLNSRMKSHGYSTPVLVATDPDAFDWVKRAVTAYVCVLVLNTKPGLAYDPDLPNPQVDRKSGFGREWNELLKMINDESFQSTRVVNRAERLVVGSAKNSDGETKDSVFSRSMWDYPGGPGANSRTSPGV